MNSLVKKHDQLMKDYFPFSVGLDSVFDRLGAITQQNLCDTFPPFNIIKEGDKTFIELALAGYNKDDIEFSKFTLYYFLHCQTLDKDSEQYHRIS